MTAAIVNLRRARKRIAREADQAAAAANRVAFGQSKAQKGLTEAERRLAARRLAGHRLAATDDE